MKIPTVLRVWWTRNRNIIFLIPMIVSIIVIILWSTTLPPIVQDWVIGVGVAVAFGVPGVLIAWFTVRAWQFPWFILTAPQLPDNVYVPLAGIGDSRALGRSPDRFATEVYSVRQLPELEEVFPDVVAPASFKIRSKGELRERIDMTGYALVFYGGMPAIGHGVEKLNVAPSVSAASGEAEGTYRRIPTFELLTTERGDYAMLTNPRVQDAMWDAWKRVRSPKEGQAAVPSLPSPPAAAKAPEGAKAYCITCKAKRDIKDPVPKQTANGRAGVSGTCPVCGKKLFAITGGKT